MPLIEHIRELRSRLLRAVIAILLGVIIGWLLFQPVWDILKQPYCDLPQSRPLGNGCRLVVNGIFDQFFIRLKVAFIVGMLVSSPVWLYQLWAFVAPGLHRSERRWTYVFMGAAIPLFLVGGALAYLVLDKGLAIFLGGFAFEDVAALITVTAYLGYATTMLLVFGLTFELPLFVLVLNLAGVLTHERIAKWRSWIIFLIFVFAAVATPSPDPFGMLALALPTVVLFEASELFAFLHDRAKVRRSTPYDRLSDDEASPLDLDGGDAQPAPAGEADARPDR